MWGLAVRAIGRLSSMAMLAGVSAKKGSPTEGLSLGGGVCVCVCVCVFVCVCL